jgi:ketosteroid isomerase-like protein
MSLSRVLALLAVLALLGVGCADDPTASEEYLDLENELVGMEQQLADATAERDVLVADIEADIEEDDGSGESIGEMVMEAWATGDQAAIDAIYAEDVQMVLDGGTIAENREEMTSTISGAISIGNTYRQVGSVVEYVASDDDLYVATLVEVVGPGHPTGVPIVGFYRVRDGKVIRHVFIDVEHF